MKRRTFLKAAFPTIFIPTLFVPIWKIVKPKPIYGSFEKFIFPHINQVIPQMLASELIDIQPMIMPSATVFYMGFITTSESDGRDGCLYVKPKTHPNNNLIIDNNDWINWRD
jgi:hypothetical protein